MEVVINKCFGGFSLSHAGVLAYGERRGLSLEWEVSDTSRKIQGEDVSPEDALMVHYWTGPEHDDDHYFSIREFDRDDRDLVAVDRELGEKANGGHAELKIVEIPDDVEWEIDEYDGLETVAETHRTWS